MTEGDIVEGPPNPEYPTVRWQRHRQRTKTAIEDASLRLFAEQGFDQTTVEELAAASGVARRTVFRYFASKSDVVFGAIEERLAMLRHELTVPGPGVDAVEVVYQAFRAVNDYQPDEYASLRTRIRLLTTVPALKAHTSWRYGAWEEEIRSALVARLGPGRALDADCLARTSLAVMWAAYEAWLEAAETAELLPFIDHVFGLVARGFSSPPG